MKKKLSIIIIAFLGLSILPVFAQKRAYVSSLPDLIIQDISWSPSSPLPGDTVTFTVYIKNQGSASTAPWGPFDVQYYIDGSNLGEWIISSLDAGQTITRQFTWTATAGSHTVSSYADHGGFIPETNENNNERQEQITVGSPDLIIQDIEWSPVSPQIGSSMTFTVYIKNQGSASTVPWGPFDVQYYIDGSNLGEWIISSLDAGQTTTRQFTWTATAGSHTVSSYADHGGFIPESNEGNNERQESFNVVSPDLIISAISWSPGSLQEGNNVTFTVYITNQGDEDTSPWGPFDVPYYIDGTKLGEWIISNIAAGNTISREFHWTAIQSSHTVSAYADYGGFIPESNEGNNERQESFNVAPPTQYTLTISVSPSAGGTTDPSPGTYQYVEGTLVTVTETPNPGYLFDHWDLDGVNVGSGTSYTVTMDGPHTLTAVFEMEQYFQLITEFMPYWNFSQGEQYYPVSFYFDNDIDVENNKDNYVVGSWDNAYVYIHIVEDENYYTIQYWLYYVFNDLVFYHDQDWDSTIFVILNRMTLQPLKVRFYRHLWPMTFDWNDPQLQKIGNHTIVYVAKGSHAAYTGLEEIRNPPNFPRWDDWKPGGIVLGPENITSWILVGSCHEEILIQIGIKFRYFCRVDHTNLNGVHPIPPGALRDGKVFWPRRFDDWLRLRFFDAPWHRDEWNETDPQTSNDNLAFTAYSPINLHVYDPLGRHVGINETGQVEIGIPDALYTGPDADPEIILIPNPIYGNYSFNIVGVETGTYNLTINRIIDNLETYHKEQNNVEIQQNETQAGIFVILEGDLNGDGIVDIVDVVIVAIAFGSAAEDDPETPWDETEKWNPDVDLNGDGIVDIVDIVMVAIHFGEAVP